MPRASSWSAASACASASAASKLRKAWIWPSTRWTWSRQACMASRAETSRAASLAVSSAMVSWFSMGRPESNAKTRRRKDAKRRTDFAPSRLCAFALSPWAWLGSFHNFRHNEQTVRGCGRVPQRFGMCQRRPGFVRPGDIGKRDGVGHRLHVADIKLLQFFDITEDLAQLRAEFFFLLQRQSKPRQMRDILHINFRCRHGGKTGERRDRRQR